MTLGINQLIEQAKPAIEEALMVCASNKELVKQYERLAGVTLQGSSSITQMVDIASGYRDAKWKEFFDFCMQYIIIPAEGMLIQDLVKK